MTAVICKLRVVIKIVNRVSRLQNIHLNTMSIRIFKDTTKSIYPFNCDTCHSWKTDVQSCVWVDEDETPGHSFDCGYADGGTRECPSCMKRHCPVANNPKRLKEYLYPEEDSVNLAFKVSLTEPLIGNLIYIAQEQQKQINAQQDQIKRLEQLVIDLQQQILYLPCVSQEYKDAQERWNEKINN
jgi:hypothetical protein